MASSKARSRRRPASGASTAGIPLATPSSPARPVRPARVTPAPEPAARAAEPAGAAGERSGPPRWFQLLTLALAVIGLALSAYETYAHFNGNHLAGCSANPHGTFDCTAVITSPQSMVFGIFPVAILGLAFYAVVAVLMTPWAWRARRREVHWVRLASMIAGMGFVMYLIYAEVYLIQEVCEYCTAVHIVTFLLFCLTVLAAAVWGLKPSER
jgi:uncharacterized membrane protein